MVYIFTVYLFYGSACCAVKAHSVDEATEIILYEFDDTYNHVSASDLKVTATAPSLIIDDKEIEFYDCHCLALYQE